MLKVILIDELGSHVKSLCEGIYESGYGVAAILKDCSNLAEQLRVHSADLAVIYTDAPSPATLHVLSTLQKQYPCPVLMFANDGSEAAIRLAMRSGVSSYVVNGLSNERLSALARVAIARFDEHQTLRRERDEATRKLSERVAIDRAKGVLMKTRNLDEDAAYHALRQLAMERGKRMGDIANEILSTAHLLLGTH